MSAPARGWTRFLPLMIFAALAVGFFIALMKPADQSLPSMRLEKPAPAFELETLAGGRMSVADLRGEGPAFVNFFASWCPPCRVEHPELKRLAGMNKARMYGVAYKDDPAATRAFLADLGDPFKTVALDLKGRTAIDWGVSGAPESFILSPSGIVIYRHYGPINPGDMERLILPAIEKAGKTP